MSSAPPSLRVYQAAQRYPGMIGIDLMTADALLWTELDVYADEERRVEAQAQQRASRAQASASRRGRGMFRGRGR